MGKIKYLCKTTINLILQWKISSKLYQTVLKQFAEMTKTKKA